MMPYSSGLYGLADWYRQLWAESLGKKLDLNGNQVNVGPTPVKALGVTDQHSQVQLYVEGPFDKVFKPEGVVLPIITNIKSSFIIFKSQSSKKTLSLMIVLEAPIYISAKSNKELRACSYMRMLLAEQTSPFLVMVENTATNWAFLI